MKVSDFYPIFYANDIEDGIRRFTENLGFTVRHRPKIEYLDYAVLENEKKRRIDVVTSHFPADNFKEGFLGMRANVDNFDEGIAYFESQGYKIFGGPHDTESSVTALMTNNDGAFLVVFHHKKKKTPDYLYNPDLCPCPRGEEAGCPRYKNCDACKAFHRTEGNPPQTACEKKAGIMADK